MKKFVLLSFDLGIDGDYRSMYAWLDDHEAKECGDGVAWLHYDCPNGKQSFEQSLKSSLEDSVKFGERSRVYALHRSEDGKIKGRFIFGRRKSAPWVGFGRHGEADEDIEDCEFQSTSD